MKFTVIIPVFNAADKIGRAIESVQKQTVEDLEIICVDDGSKDNSAEIVQDYAQKDKRIKLYHQENQGAAVSRNLALDLAQGEYIAFLDADDAYDHMKALNKIYAVAKESNADICVAKMYSISNGQKKGVVKINDLVEQRPKFRFADLQYDFYFPAYVFRREFLHKNRIRFPAKRIYEDPPFLMEAMTKTTFIYCADVDYYLYYWEKKVESMSLETLEELLNGLLEVIATAADKNYYLLKDEILNRLDSMYYEVVCRYANRPSVLKRLLQLNDYADNERINLRVLRYLMEFGWNKELYLTKKLDKLRGLSVKDKEVVIYAAGGAGMDCFELNKKYKEFKLKAWVDAQKAGEQIEDITLKNVEYLNEIQFDKIIVAMRDDRIYDEIVTKLMEMGIEPQKIIRWK